MVGSGRQEFSQMPLTCKWFHPHLDFQTGLTLSASTALTPHIHTKIHTRVENREEPQCTALAGGSLFYRKEKINFQGSSLEEQENCDLSCIHSLYTNGLPRP